MPLALALGPLRVTQPTTQQLEGIVNSLLTRKKYNQYDVYVDITVQAIVYILFCHPDGRTRMRA